MASLPITGLIHRYLSGATLVRLVPISVVLASGVALTIWTHRLLSEHRDLVVHTHEVIEMAKDVLIGLDDAETGQRGYLLSGERRYLEPYAHAWERLGTMAATLRAQVMDNAAQSEHVVRLSGLMQKKLAARSVEVQADERRVQLVAVLIGLASLLTRAGVEFYLTRQTMGNSRAKPDMLDR